MNCHVHRPPHVHILTHINPVHALPRYFSAMHAVFRVASTPRYVENIACYQTHPIQNQLITSVLCKFMLNDDLLKMLYDAAKNAMLVTDQLSIGGTTRTGENRRICGETCPSAI